eukprot:1159968-Pelagomonas_calceolata.AAC.2
MHTCVIRLQYTLVQFTTLSFTPVHCMPSPCPAGIAAARRSGLCCRGPGCLQHTAHRPSASGAGKCRAQRRGGGQAAAGARRVYMHLHLLRDCRKAWALVDDVEAVCASIDPGVAWMQEASRREALDRWLFPDIKR